MAEPFLSSSWFRVASLRPRLRPHAEAQAHSYGRRTWYILQDHATGRVHRFTPAAHMLISRMTGAATLDEIWTEVAVQLEDDAPTQDEVIRLLGQLHASDLLQLETSPQTAELLERHRKQRRSGWLAFVKNPLSGKIPLLNPDRIVAAAVRLLRPLHGVPLALLWLAFVVPALALVPLYWSDLTGNLADRVLLAQNVLALALVFPLVKIAHEFGHAYATKAFGGEVPEAGVMFLVLYPVPYVDASAALALRGKYARALVGVAGMAVEFVLAAAAFYVWLSAEAGWVRAIAFDVMLIGGLSTLVVNGNPLLRFDAYYIFSDLIEIPNLGSRANKFWGVCLDRLVFGARERQSDATGREAAWFLFYAPAAYIYRMVVFFGIALFVASEFLALGVALAIWSLVTGLVVPLGRGLYNIAKGPNLARHRTRALAVTAGAGASALALLLVVPFPLHTVAEGVIWLPEDAQIRAGTNGFVVRLLASPSSRVSVGQPLMETFEPTLASSITAQRARTEELQARLNAESVTDRVRAEITRKEWAEEVARLERLLERSGKLLVRSTSEGTWVVPGADDLPSRFVREGQVIGYVTPDGSQRVRAVVTQDDIDLVRHRLRGVAAKVAGRLHETFTAEVTREVPAARNEVPSRVLTSAGGGSLPTDPADRDGLRSLQRLFQIDVSLTPDPGEARFGSRVYLRFEHQPEPLGFQMYRRLRQLFLARFQA